MVLRTSDPGRPKLLPCLSFEFVGEGFFYEASRLMINGLYFLSTIRSAVSA